MGLPLALGAILNKLWPSHCHSPVLLQPQHRLSEAGGGADNSWLPQALARAQHQRQNLLIAVRGGGVSRKLLSDLPGTLWQSYEGNSRGPAELRHARVAARGALHGSGVKEKHAAPALLACVSILVTTGPGSLLSCSGGCCNYGTS